MATLAIKERKGDGAVTDAAIFAIVDLCHRILGRAFFDAEKDFRMTELAAVPDRMFFMGKDDFRHAFDLGDKVKVFLNDQGIPLDGNPGQEINGGYLACCFSLFPVNPVAEAAFGEILGEGAEIILLDCGSSQGMATAAFA